MYTLDGIQFDQTLPLKYLNTHQRPTAVLAIFSFNNNSYKMFSSRLQISLTVAGPVKKMVEGSDVRMLCLTKANPPEVTYRWFVNDQFALGEVTSELWLMNISRRLHNSHVRCEAQNSVDKIEESKALIILCKSNAMITIIILTY